MVAQIMKWHGLRMDSTFLHRGDLFSLLLKMVFLQMKLKGLLIGIR